MPQYKYFAKVRKKLQCGRKMRLFETYAGADVLGNLAGVHVLPLVYHIAAVLLDVFLNGLHNAKAVKEVLR